MVEDRLARTEETDSSVRVRSLLSFFRIGGDRHLEKIRQVKAEEAFRSSIVFGRMRSAPMRLESGLAGWDVNAGGRCLACNDLVVRCRLIPFATLHCALFSWCWIGPFR